MQEDVERGGRISTLFELEIVILKKKVSRGQYEETFLVRVSFTTHWKKQVRTADSCPLTNARSSATPSPAATYSRPSLPRFPPALGSYSPHHACGSSRRRWMWRHGKEKETRRRWRR